MDVWAFYILFEAHFFLIFQLQLSFFALPPSLWKSGAFQISINYFSDGKLCKCVRLWGASLPYGTRGSCYRCSGCARPGGTPVVGWAGLAGLCSQQVHTHECGHPCECSRVLTSVLFKGTSKFVAWLVSNWGVWLFENAHFVTFGLHPGPISVLTFGWYLGFCLRLLTFGI